MPKMSDEELEIARIASHSADLASANIRKYLEMHAEASFGPVKVGGRVMKIAEAMDEDMKKLVSAAAVLAAENLKKLTIK